MNRFITTTALIAGLLLSGSAIANGQQGGQGANANAGSVSGSAAFNDGNQQNIRIEGSTTYSGDIPKQAPAIAAPALTTTLSETCMGSTSMGFSGAGFGLTFGSTWRDEACVRRLDSREIRSFGAGLPVDQAILFHLAAKERMCEDPKIRAAFARVHKMTDNADALCQATAEEYEANAANAQVSRINGTTAPVEVAKRDAEPVQWNMGSDR